MNRATLFLCTCFLLGPQAASRAALIGLRAHAQVGFSQGAYDSESGQVPLSTAFEAGPLSVAAVASQAGETLAAAASVEAATSSPAGFAAYGGARFLGSLTADLRPNIYAGSTSANAYAVLRFTADADGTLLGRGGVSGGNNLGFLPSYWAYEVMPSGGLSVRDGATVFASTLDFALPLQGGHSYEVDMGITHSVSWGGGGIVSQSVFGTWVWGVDTLPGSDPGHPILPDMSDSDGFRISVPATNSTTFVDPSIATGYDYTSSQIPFRSVLVPTALPGGDHTFQLEFGGNSYALEAGTTFDFTSVVTAGVNAFRIRGIDLAESLDPNDPQAFVTGLGFVREGATEVRMDPITSASTSPVPEPSSVVIWSLFGIAAIRARRWRRKLD